MYGFQKPAPVRSYSAESVYQLFGSLKRIADEHAYAGQTE
jgi:hypothetical protein